MSEANFSEKFVLDYKKLPADVQKRIRLLQSPGEDRFVFFRGISWFYWLGAAIGLIWFAYLFIASQNLLWDEWIYWTLAGLSLIAAPIFLFSIYRIIAAKISATKNGYVFTDNELVKTEGRRVQSWSLRELESFQYLENAKTVEVWIGERQEKIPAEHFQDVARLEERFDDLKRNAGSSFLAEYAKPEYAYSASRRLALGACGLILSLLTGAGLSAAAKSLNRIYDDRQAWTLTSNAGTVEEYEKYLAKHPNGAFAAEANAKISEKLLKIKDEYLAKVGKDADRSGVSVVVGLIEEAVKRPDRTIHVVIGERLNLDENLVQKMKTATGLKIESYYATVPPTATESRKSKVLNDLTQAFLPVMRNGVAEFRLTDDPPAQSPVIRVNYAVDSLEGYYQYYEMFGGRMNTFFYPRASFTFDIKLESGRPNEVYEANFINPIVKLRDFAVNEKDAANYSFDKLLFSGASESFAEYLEKQLGFPD